jgi:hypothetical protein
MELVFKVYFCYLIKMYSLNRQFNESSQTDNELRKAVREGDIDKLDELWEAYLNGLIPYTRYQMEHDLIFVSSDDYLMIEWLFNNSILPDIILFSIFCDDEDSIRYMFNNCCISKNEKLYKIILKKSIMEKNKDLTECFFKLSTEKLTDYDIDKIEQQICSIEFRDNVEENNELIEIVEILIQKKCFHITRDTLHSAISQGKNLPLITFMLSKNPDCVALCCKATACILAQNVIWDTKIWDSVLKNKNVILDDVLLDYIIGKTNYAFDGRIFIKHGVKFTEKHVLIAIKRDQTFITEHLIKYCNVEPTQAIINALKDSELSYTRALAKKYSCAAPLAPNSCKF